MKYKYENATNFLVKTRKENQVLADSNQAIKDVCGINNFIKDEYEYDEIINYMSFTAELKENRTGEYGDFQTRASLTDLIISELNDNNICPDILIEPTCGTGNFILSALKKFPALKRIYGIELYHPYLIETKIKLLDYYLNVNPDSIPEIELIERNIFDVEFAELIELKNTNNILIIGNPPWVTNSQLGVLNSSNLPAKSNFKGHNGIDAITGKGNFDIAEYITLMLIKYFSGNKGSFSFLLKNSVIKNIIASQKYNNYHIGNIIQYSIDSKKEFDISADASLLYCELNKTPEYTCSRASIYNPKEITTNFGYFNDKFVSNINDYKSVEAFDNTSPLIWRQGIKHDCAAIMELEKSEGKYRNKNGEELSLEEPLIYGFLKSSDLKSETIKESRLYTIVTQNKTGSDTEYIKRLYPALYKYLSENKDLFEKRKSSIYKGKPAFSIFGVGDYSFKPYKVAISGLYKRTSFSLVIPSSNKPLMLDDTCYFIGFDELLDAAITLITLNHSISQKLIGSLIFYDSKRVITKELLMRIDLYNIAKSISFEYYSEKLKNYDLLKKDITPKSIVEYLNKLEWGYGQLYSA